MELSGLIFVALAVAWAAYLIPKALQHHDEVVRSRSVDRFSQRMRVLARREPVSGRNARLVVTPTRATAPPVVTTKGPAIAEEQARRRAIGRATRRRRRVLGLLVLANAAVVTVAAFHLIAWWWTAVPAALLVVWLLACRLMVRSERGLGRSVRPSRRGAAHDAADGHVADATAGLMDGDDPFEDTMASPLAAPAVVAAGGDPDMWDPLPVTLPTYVSKPVARRTVRTIDLDATGVWSSGRSEVDSALAREADAAHQAERARTEDGGPDRRVVGS